MCLVRRCVEAKTTVHNTGYVAAVRAPWIRGSRNVPCSETQDGGLCALIEGIGKLIGMHVCDAKGGAFSFLADVRFWRGGRVGQGIGKRRQTPYDTKHCQQETESLKARGAAHSAT